MLGLNRVGASGSSSNQGADTHIHILNIGVRTSTMTSTPRQPGSGLLERAACRVQWRPRMRGRQAGHGTHCTGSAGGAYLGVASASNIYGVKVLGDNGGGSFAAVVGAIDWLATAETRPAVGIMSLSGTCPRGGADLVAP